MQCQVDIPAISGLNDRELTVGREFFLTCKGEWPRNLVQDKLQFKLADAEKYQIRLLGFEFRAVDEADLKVTTYKSGSIKLANLQISDGAQTVDLGPVQYEVKSILQKAQDGQQIKPYGPIGPAKIPIPAVYLVALALVAALLVSWIGFKIYRFRQRRRLLAKLRQHDSALAPLQQFHQNLRQLQRRNVVFFGREAQKEDLQQAFDALNLMLRLYLIRSLHVPAMEWGDSLILRDIKKYHPLVFREEGSSLRKLLGEFGSAQKNRERLTSQDILVLAEQSRKLAEKIDRTLAEKGKSR